ncbi:MAG: hypothetical protein ACK5LN_13060 [Propioniciclava sp.]
MRTRDPDLSPTISIRDTYVIADRLHRALLSPTLCETGCHFIDDWEARPRSAPAVVVETRTDSLWGILGDVAQHQAAMVYPVTMLAPREHLDVVRVMQQAPDADDVAITKIATDGAWTAVTLVPAKATDPDATALLDALDLGLSMAAGHSTASAQTELLRTYAALLELIQHDARWAPSAADQNPPKTDDRIRTLEQRLIHTVADRDALARKYAALAGSRLGSLTLKWWEHQQQRLDNR